MGIPSYFSYIVKNHLDIIKRLQKKTMEINHLYMDCNSIIYDAVRNINFAELTESANKMIAKQVIQKIEEYIDLIEPNGIIYIAFDGVAPVAKLEQQRNRRYKSVYQTSISKTFFKDKKKGTPDPWNTTAITPGTVFMQELNISIVAHFTKESYGAKSVIVSTSDEPGEGEHKIFDYIRRYPELNTGSIVIYGLDADLIMLSINHLPICPEIYLFRETPEFIKSIDASLEPNETYLLDIPLLSKAITADMSNSSEDDGVNRVYDYIFLCFFLGNDFMPHFPAINIRTGGVNKMLNAYKATIGTGKEVLTDGKRIIWKNVRRLVAHLAELEEEYIKTETKLRDKREKVFLPTDTPEQRYARFDAIPTYERELEKYINPYKDDWQARYYKCLLQMDGKDEGRVRQLANNYLEGLEWTMKYYTSGCPDWTWCYHHHYPPLLQDLVKYIPYFDCEFIKPCIEKPVSQLVQLCYVLPRQSLSFLPEPLYKRLIKEKEAWYPTDCEFVWAYSKYFWESHVDLPEIDIVELTEFIENV
jgi:hypothetical protein